MEDLDTSCCDEDGGVILDVECGKNKAKLYVSRLCQGSKGSCVLFRESWLTPNEFQFVSGRQTAKDWKRSIRHQGKSLKLLLGKGVVELHPSVCVSEGCRKTLPKRKTRLGTRQRAPLAENVELKETNRVSDVDGEMEESGDDVDNSCDDLKKPDSGDSSVNGDAACSVNGDTLAADSDYYNTTSSEDSRDGGSGCGDADNKDDDDTEVEETEISTHDTDKRSTSSHGDSRCDTGDDNAAAAAEVTDKNNDDQLGGDKSPAMTDDAATDTPLAENKVTFTSSSPQTTTPSAPELATSDDSCQSDNTDITSAAPPHEDQHSKSDHKPDVSDSYDFKKNGVQNSAEESNDAVESDNSSSESVSDKNGQSDDTSSTRNFAQFSDHTKKKKVPTATLR